MYRLLRNGLTNMALANLTVALVLLACAVLVAMPSHDLDSPTVVHTASHGSDQEVCRSKADSPGISFEPTLSSASPEALTPVTLAGQAVAQGPSGTPLTPLRI